MAQFPNAPATAHGVTEFSDRTLLFFTGADRLRYLNGQVTNDVSKASPDRAIYACITNAKGKLEADIYLRVFTSGGEEGYLIDGPAELREALATRLERYIIADDVEVEDITDSYCLFHQLGGEAPKEFPLGAPEWSGSCDRFGQPGRDVIVRSGDAVEIRASLTAAGENLEEETLERVRISHGIPVWGKELGPDLLPPEARLEDRAIDYQKGCYIGQEVISRIRSAGKVNRLLSILWAEDGGVTAGDQLFLKADDGGLTPVGVVTSVADASSEADGAGKGQTALGFVKRAASEPGTRLSCGNGENSLSTSVLIGEIPHPSPG